VGAQIFHSAPSRAYCPSCAGKPHERQDKLTVADLEKLSGASRGAPAAEFDTAYRCQVCSTIYSSRYGVSFALLEAPRARSLRQSWQLFLVHARSSVYGRLLSHRTMPGSRWHNVVARDHAIEQRHDTLLASIAGNVADVVRPVQSAVDDPVYTPLAVQDVDTGIAGPAPR
jgi:rubredoxin